MQNWNRQSNTPLLSSADDYRHCSVEQIGGIVSILPEHGRVKLNAGSSFAASNIITCTNNSSKDQQNEGLLLPFFGPSVNFEKFPLFDVNHRRPHTGSNVDIPETFFSNFEPPYDQKATSHLNGAFGVSTMFQDSVNASSNVLEISNNKRYYERVRNYAIERERLVLLTSIIQSQQVKQSPLIDFLRECSARPNIHSSGPWVEQKLPSHRTKEAQYFAGQRRVSTSLNLKSTREHQIENQKISSQACQLSTVLQNDILSEVSVSKCPNVILLKDLLSDSKFVSLKLRGHASDSLILAFAQMEPCRLDTFDKLGKYKHRKLNSIGMCCRHCGGSPGCGRFFPSTYASFVNGTNPEYILGHVGHVCQACPLQIREAIQQLERHEASKPLKLRYGSRKRFFFYFWKRIHEYGDKLPLVGVKPPSEEMQSSKAAVVTENEITCNLGNKPIAKRARLC